MLDAVYWDRENLDTLEGILRAASDVLCKAAKMMKKDDGLSPGMFEHLMETRNEMACRLAAFDGGVGLTAKQREQISEIEDAASELISMVSDEWDPEAAA